MTSGAFAAVSCGRIEFEERDRQSFISAVADTYVSEVNPELVHGFRAFLRVDAQPRRVAFVRFDTALLPDDYGSVRLRVFAETSSVVGITAHEVGSEWDEDTVLATAPALGAVITTSPPFDDMTWLQWQLVDLVQPPLPLDVALVLDNDTEVRLSSREGVAAPHLMVSSP